MNAILAEFRDRLARDIPVARAMGIDVVGWEHGQFCLAAPLALNRNDKGTAFAGSLYSCLVLAGWAAVTLALAERGWRVEVAVAESATRFRRPVAGPFEARTAALADAVLATAVQVLGQGGRPRIGVDAWVGPESAPTVLLQATYVVRSRTAADRTAAAP